MTVVKGVANLFYQLFDNGHPEYEPRARTVEIYGIFYDVHCGHLAEFGQLKATVCIEFWCRALIKITCNE